MNISGSWTRRNSTRLREILRRNRCNNWNFSPKLSLCTLCQSQNIPRTYLVRNRNRATPWVWVGLLHIKEWPISTTLILRRARNQFRRKVPHKTSSLIKTWIETTNSCRILKIWLILIHLRIKSKAYLTGMITRHNRHGNKNQASEIHKRGVIKECYLGFQKALKEEALQNRESQLRQVVEGQLPIKPRSKRATFNRICLKWILKTRRTRWIQTFPIWIKILNTSSGAPTHTWICSRASKYSAITRVEDCLLPSELRVPCLLKIT